MTHSDTVRSYYQSERICWLIRYQTKQQSTQMKLRPALPPPVNKKKKAQGFHHQCWYTPYNKQPCDAKEAEWRGPEWSEESSLSESLSCMRVTLSASSVTPEFILAALTDVSTERRSTPQCLLTKAAVWPASVLTALTAFKEQRFYFFFPPLFFFGGGVDLLLLCPSPCLFLPSGFFWFLWQQVFRL